MQTTTRLNLSVLARTFKTADRVSAHVSPADAPHLVRCMRAGLLRAEGSELILTDAGIARVRKPQA
jgi:hypothetical protein